jgi:hypothetical protein
MKMSVPLVTEPMIKVMVVVAKAMVTMIFLIP